MVAHPDEAHAWAACSRHCRSRSPTAYTMPNQPKLARMLPKEIRPNPESPRFPVDIAVDRFAAARRAIDGAGGDTLPIGRAENFFVGVPDLDDTLTRLHVFARVCASRSRLSLRARHRHPRANRSGGCYS
jgi:hypothetical protein